MAAGAPRESQTAQGSVCASVYVSEMICTSSWSRAMTLGTSTSGTSNWGDWDPGTAARQGEHLSPAAGGVRVLTGG